MIQDVHELMPQSPYRYRPDLIDPFANNPYVMTPSLGFLPLLAAVSSTSGDGNIVDKLLSFLHIGAGRQEADQIVPYQNEVHYNVLAPISKALEGTPDYYSLQSMYKTLTETESAWLRFLHETQWSDGRAAVQAEATLAPFFSGLKNELVSRMAAGPPSVIDTISNVFTPDVPIQPVTFPGGVTVTPAPVYPYGDPNSGIPTPTYQASMFPVSGSSWLLPVAVGVVLLMLSQRKGR